MLEFLVGSSLVEIYFLHERGIPVAYVTIAFSTDKFGSPIISACGTLLCWVASISLVCVFSFKRI